MRIDTMNGTSYQPPQPQQAPQAPTTGTESKVVEKPRVENTTAKNTEIVNQEAQVAAEERQQQSEHEVIKAIEKANTHIRTYDRKLEFSIHDTTKQIMVKVINTADDSIIREIPSEKVLDMVAHMWEVAGILVDKKI